MSVLELSKKLQKFMGIYREDGSGLSGKLYMGFMNAIFVLGLSVLVVGSFAYICVNLADMSTSTNAMIVLFGGMSGVGCYCGITSNFKSIQKLYALLQQLVDESNINGIEYNLINLILKYFSHFYRFEISQIHRFL